MDRLTKKINGIVGPNLDRPERTTPSAWLEKVQNRLAAYEDTGFTPEEIVKMRQWLEIFDTDRYGELVAAEEDGRLIVLEKHKIEEGRTVWALDLRRKIIYEGTVSYCDDFYSMHFDSPEWSFPFGNGHIGSYVFLSLEEAEAAQNGGSKHEK